MAKISLSSETAESHDARALEFQTKGETIVQLGAQRIGEDDLSEPDADRRRAGRAGVTVRIDYSTVDEMFSEFTRDINEGGLFIETEKPHRPGTEVSMQFHLPGSREVLHTLGRVVRVSSGDPGAPSGMGIEFDELTPDDRVKIDQIVRALRSGGSI